ncbi:MAG: hypothetical protein BGO01_16605 [Armatimonadetes bacterium 55-13]|nr:hypothetical protein [Armatimonadota bacterium]OJU65478.1 MAG: hypothetical protein BGO01_16605 [Armatimonadetes bacterium 55-13]
MLSLLVGMAMFQSQGLPVPPPMTKRTIMPPAVAPAGKQIKLYGDDKYVLFVPDAWKPVSHTGITLHFHGAIWFAIDEHLRRGLKEPLIAVYVGEGSTVYRNAFEDPAAWTRLLAVASAELGASINRVDVTSFSAGYGAVRELLQQPDPFRLIRRVVLADSMYASFTSDADHTPLKTQIDPYVAFAEAAVRGEKDFVVTFSQVPTEAYANSAACAAALVARVGGSLVPVEKGSLPATQDEHFPLLSRFDQGNFHVWGYGGVDAQAHMTHPRHIADVWKAVFSD